MRPTESEHEFIRKELNRRPKPKIYRSGWPDFFLLYPDGSYRFVEVKSPNDKVQPHQMALHEAFVKAGLKIEIIVCGRSGISNPRKRGICPNCNQEKSLNKDNLPVWHRPCGYVWHMKEDLMITGVRK